jgi:hypothetical protein
VLGLVVIALALLLAGKVPSLHCTYQGDSGTCVDWRGVKWLIGSFGVLIGVGLMIWAVRAERPSHWETRRSPRVH